MSVLPSNVATHAATIASSPNNITAKYNLILALSQHPWLRKRYAKVITDYGWDIIQYYCPNNTFPSNYQSFWQSLVSLFWSSPAHDNLFLVLEMTCLASMECECYDIRNHCLEILERAFSPDLITTTAVQASNGDLQDQHPSPFTPNPSSMLSSLHLTRSLRVLLLRGRSLENGELWQDALKTYNQILQHGSTLFIHHQTNMSLIHMLLRVNQTQNGVNLLIEHTKLHTDDISAWMLLFEQYSQWNQFDNAIMCASHIILLTPGYPRAHGLLAQVYQQNAQYLLTNASASLQSASGNGPTRTTGGGGGSTSQSPKRHNGCIFRQIKFIFALLLSQTNSQTTSSPNVTKKDQFTESSLHEDVIRKSLRQLVMITRQSAHVTNQTTKQSSKIQPQIISCEQMQRILPQYIALLVHSRIHFANAIVLQNRNIMQDVSHLEQQLQDKEQQHDQTVTPSVLELILDNKSTIRSFKESFGVSIEYLIGLYQVSYKLHELFFISNLVNSSDVIKTLKISRRSIDSMSLPQLSSQDLLSISKTCQNSLKKQQISQQDNFSLFTIAHRALSLLNIHL